MSEGYLLRADAVLDVSRTEPADAVATAGGRILSVGAFDDLRREHSSLEVLDLSGRTLLSGLTDTHCHFYELARRLVGVDLRGAGDEDELRARLTVHGARMPRDGSWVAGGGWSPERFLGRPGIDRHFLDGIFGARPVALESRDFHTLWCNTAALEAAGVMDGAEAPPGGEIGRGEDGSPDGLLYETAWELIWAARPPEPVSTRAAWLRRAQEHAHARGVTGLHTMEPEAAWEGLCALAAEDGLRLRVWHHSPLDHLEERIAAGEAGYARRGDDGWLRRAGVKIFMDGSLGSQSAWMLDPYPDGGRGRPLMPAAELEEILLRAGRAGIPGSVHAIGDATVRACLDAFEGAARRLAGEGRTLPAPGRIEHAQCVRPEDLGRLAALDLVCAMQPVHMADDIPLLPRLWPVAQRFAYPTRSMREAGVFLCLGSDAPVAPLDPRPGLYCAMERRAGADPAGEAFLPEEALREEEALAGYTLWAARAGRREAELGRVARGLRADLTALRLPEGGAERWLHATVDLTMVEGEVVYEAGP